ncbi:MAG: ABC transporter ATP-binding protein [Chloroflexota bacterium]|nr:ABC transporter ATP-binding protein [Chloroflexota bacterium]
MSKTFTTRAGPVQAVADVTFEVAAGEFVSIVGPSGCGKSTLLRLLAGLLDHSSGQVRFETEPAGARPRNAMVFQEHGIFPWLTVIDNVAFGLEMQGVPGRERRARARTFLAQVGLQDVAGAYPHELSVGMRQRVAIARAFLTDPELLLMDEPFSALDAQSKLVLQEELLRIWRDHQKTVIYVTHDIEEAVLLGDRVLVMGGHPGRVRETIQVPLGRPRNLRDREQPQVRTIAWHIWQAIEDEVRQRLRISA